MATEKECNDSYEQEHGSWVKEQVFEEVPRSSASKDNNILSSHVACRWKDEHTTRERLKARILPHGNRDNDKNLLRADSPSMKPEVLRMMCSFAIDYGCKLKSIDIKTAFLQTGELEREVHVVPPKESGIQNVLGKLLKTVYGLVDGPTRWHRHCRDALLEFGLKPFIADPTLHLLKGPKGEPHQLVVVIDDFLCTGIKSIMNEFEEFIKSKCTIGHISSGNFKFNGIDVKCDDRESCYVCSAELGRGLISN